MTAQACRALLAGTVFLAPLSSSVAADTNSGDANAAASAPAAAPAPVIRVEAGATKLPYGVEDVLKLSRAQISEDIILNYVQNSGTIYNLAPKDIVYLRDQGVSDKVLNAMLNQRKRVELAAQTTQPVPSGGVAPTAGQVAPDVTSQGPVANPGDQGPVYAEAPLTPPASSVYTIPYAPSYYAPYYYPYYPYYYGGWYGPSIAFGFRFGGHGGFHGGHGGFHGGGHSFAGHGGHR